MPQLSLHSPVGDLAISEEDGFIISVDWGWGSAQDDTPVLLQAQQQLQDYFDGKRQTFDLPLRPTGTAFQKKVWALMQQIPFGQTLTYGQMAHRLGSAARAIGGACGANPIPILIPCHRVLAQNHLGGYSGDGGLETKTFLLRHEGALL